jgi:DNA-binding MarR family transcriptional regulator
VERVPDPADGRAKLVRATARGRDVFAVVRGVIGEYERYLDERLGAEEVRRLRGLLEELSDALQAPGAP